MFTTAAPVPHDRPLRLSSPCHAWDACGPSHPATPSRHCLGDMLTKEGCPLLWPVIPTRFKVANLTTDRFTERVIIGPALTVVAFVQVAGLLVGWEAILSVVRRVPWAGS
jgi:hypothetical protein